MKTGGRHIGVQEARVRLFLCFSPFSSFFLLNWLVYPSAVPRASSYELVGTA